MTGPMGSIVTGSLLPQERKPRAHLEDDLQRAVCQYLRWSLPADAEYFAIPNGGLRHGRAAARLAGQGLRAGIPDLCVVHHGSAYFIELKSAAGALSEVQRQMRRKLEYCGCAVVTCKTLACVENSLIELGIPLRTRVSA
jgi:hypothetical protein